MKWDHKFKETLLSIVLIAALAVSMILPAAAGSSTVQAKETAIQYKNSVFTKNLYQNTKKIGFGSGETVVIKDSQTVKKIYKLLAAMELKVLKDPKKEKTDTVTLIVYKKNGNKKTYKFTGDCMSAGGKSYQITKNDPVSSIRKIFYPDTENAVVKAVYPKMSPYPNEEDYRNAKGEFDDAAYSKAYDAWWQDLSARNQAAGYTDGLDGFLAESTRQFLSNAGKENRIYSPLNVYMALGMLAELTDGNSRQQILNLLGSKDIQTLRQQASGLWNANYRDDGIVTSILASSLWMNENIKFNAETMNTLAANYYASSFKGKMGSDELNQALQNWLNEQTGGLLKEQASKEELNQDTILALAASVYFRARWHHEFLKDNTEKDVFHADDGDLSCDFMKKKSQEVYYWGDKFSAAAQRLEKSGAMWFLLPNEGVTPDDLLKDTQAVNFLTGTDRQEWKNQKSVMLNLSVPKFDVSSRIGLKEGLKSMGITDVFDDRLSDFSPMTADTDSLYVSKADHAARVAVDEEGVAAAAYTVMGVSTTSAPVIEDEIDFVLDRPFLFAVTGSDGLPLFVGVVNQP